MRRGSGTSLNALRTYLFRDRSLCDRVGRGQPTKRGLDCAGRLRDRHVRCGNVLCARLIGKCATHWVLRCGFSGTRTLQNKPDPYRLLAIVSKEMTSARRSPAISASAARLPYLGHTRRIKEAVQCLIDDRGIAHAPAPLLQYLSALVVVACIEVYEFQIGLRDSFLQSLQKAKVASQPSSRLKHKANPQPLLPTVRFSFRKTRHASTHRA